MKNKLSNSQLRRFVGESNMIEGIFRDISPKDLEPYETFLDLPKLDVDSIASFVQSIEPFAKLRDQTGMNVIIENHMPLPGGARIFYRLQELLTDVNEGVCTPYKTHLRYEHLHPFMDGNGRSGRMIWLWQMLHQNHNDYEWKDRSFLHTHYYQSLYYNIYFTQN